MSEKPADDVEPYLTFLFCKVVRKSQFPYTFVKVFFILVIIKDKLTDLCGN